MQNLIKYLLLLTTISINACDVCSCGASGNSFMGINSNNHYVSFTYNYLNFKFKDGVHDNSPYGYDDIHQINIKGQYVLNNDLAFQLSIPLQGNYRTTEDDQVSKQGLGDVTINAIYTFFEHKYHYFKTGFGVKLPTGEFDIQNASSTNTSATQLGTGSLDFNIPLEYRYIKDRFISRVKATYFYKTENNSYFKFGNQKQIQGSVTYKIIKKPKSSYSLNIGASYDDYEETETNGSKNLRTDGFLLNSNFGLNYENEKFILGINYQHPIEQNLIEGEVLFKKGIGFYSYYKF